MQIECKPDEQQLILLILSEKKYQKALVKFNNHQAAVKVIAKSPY
jgi:hypothetical protein